MNKFGNGSFQGLRTSSAAGSADPAVLDWQRLQAATRRIAADSACASLEISYIRNFNTEFQ
jgi:hypothetical protein